MYLLFTFNWPLNRNIFFSFSQYLFSKIPIFFRYLFSFYENKSENENYITVLFVGVSIAFVRHYCILKANDALNEITKANKKYSRLVFSVSHYMFDRNESWVRWGVYRKNYSNCANIVNSACPLTLWNYHGLVCSVSAY